MVKATGSLPEGAFAGYASSAPGSREVSVEYLLVDNDGRILAALPSVGQVALELARMDPQAGARVRIVRHEEHGDDVAGASSFVEVTPLPALLRDARAR